jgi:hypothetical protein
MALQPRLILAAAALCALLVGCNERGVREVLDEETYVSVVSVTPPFNFFRLLLEGSAEREFLSVGPIERIRSADRDRYLWVNAWAVRKDGAHESVMLGESITLETGSGDILLTRAAGNHAELDISRPAYRIIRSGEGEAIYTMTDDDLDQLRGETLIAIRSEDRRYELWGNQSDAQASLQDFIVTATGY